MDTVAPFQFHHLQLSSHSRLAIRTSRSVAIKLPSPNLVVSSRASSNENSVFPILKTVCITMAVTAALLFAGCSIFPAISVPVAASCVEEDRESEKVDDEMVLREKLCRNPVDKEALRQLMEVRIQSKKLMEAVEVLNKLIDLEPEEVEWRLVKAQIHAYNGEMGAARRGFEEILKCNPSRAEAYHGLVMVESESGNPLNALVTRLENAMDECRKEKRVSGIRELKMVVAQVKVMEGKYRDALRVYEEMVKEDPRDFRPYLCQGIIYNLLGDNHSAEEKFEQFKRFVPTNHPFREYIFHYCIRDSSTTAD